MNGIYLFLNLLFVYLFSVKQISSEEERQKYEVASDYPFYMNFSVADNLRITTRLETKEKGDYQIVLGGNDSLPSRYASIISVKLNGEYHKEIQYQSVVKNGRIFLEIHFSIKDGDAYKDRYVDCFLFVPSRKERKLSAKENDRFSASILEFGFRKL
ncbi:hypothetical protein LFX25_12675 [Leptospira sp. FAT2]|uniref:hypothetical protein n=1 Tax=Leptospira sanjuanensis TaxID=2879643 RepID=UPI001EE7C109|nr:hypothetical protein [Leptospira sanjuanensis]MCG6194098.1 hypothetical protein [Leptospira sanjuanensis]